MLINNFKGCENLTVSFQPAKPFFNVFNVESSSTHIKKCATPRYMRFTSLTLFLIAPRKSNKDPENELNVAYTILTQKKEKERKKQHLQNDLKSFFFFLSDSSVNLTIS